MQAGEADARQGDGRRPGAGAGPHPRRGGEQDSGEHDEGGGARHGAEHPAAHPEDDEVGDADEGDDGPEHGEGR
ncbi:hypothetical protein CLV92_11824 [Kineococcus xinjiangensis]|uniref:Uncharacterized protein n=1 Tax=Kineococcus xinjiangensis TaxID=512762 RepID=A0A2S6ICT6_9ACTN|nr:hypothetical protein CLV92_11824 [Kineococcus xinjiangensis]